MHRRHDPPVRFRVWIVCIPFPYNAVFMPLPTRTAVLFKSCNRSTKPLASWLGSTPFRHFVQNSFVPGHTRTPTPTTHKRNHGIDHECIVESFCASWAQANGYQWIDINK